MASSLSELSSAEFNSKVVQSKVPVLVDFSAEWCQPCRMQAPILQELAQELKDKAVVYSIDVDENRDLALQFNVRSIPTIILFNNGEVIKQWVGLTQKSEIKKKIEEITSPLK